MASEPGHARRKAPVPLRRSIERFTSDPASIRNATRLIVVVTAVIVLAGGFVVWLFDRNEFPDYGRALWYTLQTVTTVGYGDAVPTSVIGRSVGAIVMIGGVALLSVVTASITSTFVEAAQRRHRAGQHEEHEDQDKAMNARFDDVDSRLLAIERLLVARGADPRDPANGKTTASVSRPAAEA